MKKNTKITNFLYKRKQSLKLGMRTSMAYESDPVRLVFTLSRYKFVAKMFDGFDSVLEVGAGDGFKSPIVQQFCKKLTISDIETQNKDDFDQINFTKTKFIIHDFINYKLKKKFDGIYSLDVLEHIHKKDEKKFIKNICNSLKKTGTLIIGMPTLESQIYASKWSKEGHVNCKTKKELKNFLSSYFNNIYMFSMNDEMVHTGYDSMSHYIFALACNKKQKLK
ncbi:MAG: SAM-dependent methyltransferase [Candidatus Pelagibacter sp.]|nr:SAM-dependent methyltransferase [Candidatus Pelagibacter sp.]